jgi:protein O-GlcNAc transferase
MDTLPTLLQRAAQHLSANQFAEARPLLDQALTLDPDNLDANTLAGFVAAKQRRWPDARDRYAKASTLRPDDFNLAFSAGECAFFSLDMTTAVTLLQRATTLDPTNVQARFTLGKALSLTDNPASAFPVLRDVLTAINEKYLVHLWLGQTLRNTGQPDAAVEQLRQAAALAPANIEIRAQLAVTMNYAATVTATDLAAAHRDYGRLISDSTRTAPRPTLNVRRGPRPTKLRIGLLSPDLKRHSVSHFLLPIVEHLDPSRFEVYCYHALAEEDQFSARYKAAAHTFRNISALNGVRIAEQIAADNVHILVDLAGYTSNTRVPVLALRAAPVQMTYLGYPNTTGIAECDYRITDSLTDPAPHAALHTEKLLSVDPCSHTFAPLDGWDIFPEPSPPPCLTQGHITFGCFGAIMKFSDELVRMLTQTVLAVENSKLLIKIKYLRTPEAQADLRARFAHAGLRDPNRLLLEGPVARDTDMFREYQRADIILDTFPYHGTTTTCECLSVGVPVVTRLANRTAARVGLSLLSAAGLADLAADDDRAFINTARSLAADTPRLASLRTELPARTRASLGDPAVFCRRFEAALDRAWDESR